MGISLNLEKGIQLDLTKEFGKLDKIHLGLGWDTRMDLDAFAIMFDKDGKRIGTVCYSNKSQYGVQLSGDNLTGDGDGDDETIYVHVSSLSPKVHKISLFANIYSAGSRTFDDVKGTFMRLIDGSNGQELAKYSLSDRNRNYNAFHFADLTVNDGELSFEIIGQGLNGSISKIESICDNKDKPNTPKKKWLW